MRQGRSINAPLLTLVVPGTVLAGKFHVIRRIGRGGMGLVVEAHHMELDERVALKFLQYEAKDEAVQLQRFYREARSAAKLKSEHVTHVLDVGRLDSGEPYMVMEHLTGIDLSKHLRAEGRLRITESVDYVIQAMDAVAEAHANGIIHRDLKPANLFLAQFPDGTRKVKVLDFGIAKQSNDDYGTGLTGKELVFGSMVYMSPEQTKSTRDVDERTDIYALGITLYELIAGRTPFYAKLVPEIIAQKAEGRGTPIRELAPEVPEALARVITRAYERDRDKRYRTVAELAKALAPFASDESKHLLARIERVTEHTSKSFPRAKLAPELQMFAKEIEQELGVDDTVPDPSELDEEWSDEWSDEYSLKTAGSASDKGPKGRAKAGPSSAPPEKSAPRALSVPPLGAGGSGIRPMSIAELVPDKPTSTARSATLPPPSPRALASPGMIPAPPAVPKFDPLSPVPPPDAADSGAPAGVKPAPAIEGARAAQEDRLRALPSGAASPSEVKAPPWKRTLTFVVAAVAGLALLGATAGISWRYGRARGASPKLTSNSIDVIAQISRAAGSSEAQRDRAEKGTDPRPNEQIPAQAPSMEASAPAAPTATPTTTPSSAPATAPPQLFSPAVIKDAFQARQPAFEACYAGLPDALRKAPTGVVVVAVEVAPGGETANARIHMTSIPNAEGEACVLREARSMKFPPPAKVVNLMHSLRIPLRK